MGSAYFKLICPMSPYFSLNKKYLFAVLDSLEYISD